MMQLPARLDEAEAYQFARDWIDEQRQWGFHPDAERLHGKQWMKQYLQFGPSYADEVKFWAEQGHEQAHLALQEAIDERVDRNEPLGAVLGAYDIRLRNRFPKPAGRPIAFNTSIRDCVIALLVYEMQTRFPKLGIYWNGKSKRETLTTIAARALKDAGIIAVDHKTIAKIFDRYWIFRKGSWPQNGRLR